MGWNHTDSIVVLTWRDAVWMALLVAGFVTGYSPIAKAEVRVSQADGFVSEHQLQLAGSPRQAYVALTRHVHRWWDASHSFSGQASNFRLQAKAGGCFCERLAQGGSVEHMRVLFAEPGKLLRLAGGLGPLQGMGASGVMDFAFTKRGNNTQLSYRYTVVGADFMALDKLAAAVDAVQLGQLKRLQQYLLQQPKPLQ